MEVICESRVRDVVSKDQKKDPFCQRNYKQVAEHKDCEEDLGHHIEIVEFAFWPPFRAFESAYENEHVGADEL